ncbi:hypothetical protein SSAG_05113 [Streptomyces sp. Mg1]|nr:hypothetical protein SSAG_05113 [Streptomyces sp. Mg1]
MPPRTRARVGGGEGLDAEDEQVAVAQDRGVVVVEGVAELAHHGAVRGEFLEDAAVVDVPEGERSGAPEGADRPCGTFGWCPDPNPHPKPSRSDG